LIFTLFSLGGANVSVQSGSLVQNSVRTAGAPYGTGANTIDFRNSGSPKQGGSNTQDFFTTISQGITGLRTTYFH